MADPLFADLQLVEVVWIDSHSPATHAWLDLDDLEGLSANLECRSSGYVVDQETTDQVLTLASRVSQAASGKIGQLYGVLAIPRAAIVSLREIPAIPPAPVED